MTSGMKTVIYPVKDLAAATRLYTELLGVAPHTEQPYYVGFNVEGVEVGLDPNGHASGLTGPVGYWHVEDMDKALAGLHEVGATTEQAPRDVGGGKLVASVKDADGNVVGVIQDPPGGAWG